MCHSSYRFIIFLSSLVIISHQQNVNPNEIVLTPFQKFEQIEILKDGKVTVTLEGIPSNASFSVIQANAYMETVTLSYNQTLAKGYFTSGSNIGLVLYKGNNARASVYLQNPNNNSVHVLLGVQFYDTNAPVPGACNMEEPIRTAPYLPTLFTKFIIKVNYPLASWPLNVRPVTCDTTPLQYDIYHYYLPEKDFNMNITFKYLQLMSDVKSIEANGRKVAYYGDHKSILIFANYIGTGTIIAVIARGLTSSAAYVPALSLGCLPMNTGNGVACIVGSSFMDKVFWAALVFIGLFLTLVGHRFYKSQLFFLGFCIVSFIGDLALETFVELDGSVNMTIAVILGIIGGLALLLFWIYSGGSPCPPVFLGGLVIGTLFGSIIAFTPLADYSIFKENLTFWMAFLCLILCGPILLFSFSQLASILFTTLVGSYLFIIPIDYYAGGNMKFIVLNIWRRATVSDFRTAILDPPFQTTDLILSLVWAGLATVGTLLQLWREKGRAPFPPPPVWSFTLPWRRRRRRIENVNPDTDPYLDPNSETRPLLQ